MHMLANLIRCCFTEDFVCFSANLCTFKLTLTSRSTAGCNLKAVFHFLCLINGRNWLVGYRKSRQNTVSNRMVNSNSFTYKPVTPCSAQRRTKSWMVSMIGFLCNLISMFDIHVHGCRSPQGLCRIPPTKFFGHLNIFKYI